MNCLDRIASLCEDERLRRALKLFAGDGGKYDGVESLSGLFTFFLAPLVPGQRSSTSLGGVIGRAPPNPENWSISAMFSVASSRTLYKFARWPFFSTAFFGIPRVLFKRQSPYQIGLNRGYVAQCINMHLKLRVHGHNLPSSSQHREEL